MKYLILAIALLLVSCKSSLPADPAQLRLQASQIENATQQAQAYAQAAAVERQQATAAVGTAVAMDMTRQQVDFAMAVARDSATSKARQMTTAVAAQATSTAVIKSTMDAQEQILFDQGVEYDRQVYRQEIFIGYAWALVKILIALAVLGLIVLGIVGIARRPQNHQPAPQFVEHRGVLLIQDMSRQSSIERLLAPGNAPWVQVGRQRPVEEEQPLMLPAPSTLPEIKTGHVLIAGETGSGKSTAMKAILAPRNKVTVLDPHAEPSAWGNAHVIGGGRNFEAIEDYMSYMRRVLSERYASRSSGNTDFETITVATDEMPAIVAALGRAIEDSWREWLREGRKVGLFFVVSTQSTRVKTLGIKGEGDLLENFSAVIELGKVAQNNHPELVAGQERPAILSTIHGSRAVVIPHNPDNRSMQTNYVAPPPLFDDPRVTGLETEKGTITPRELGIIRDMLIRGASGNEIQRMVWGNSGGEFYYKLQRAKEYLATV